MAGAREDFEDELLDDSDPYLSNNQLMDFIGWWERGRLFYNLAQIVAYAIAIGLNWYNAVNMGFVELGLWFLIYTLVANLCYTIGWAIEILRSYYFKRESSFFLRNKVWFWLVGTSLSGAFLYHMSTNYLENWSPFVFFQF